MRAAAPLPTRNAERLEQVGSGDVEQASTGALLENLGEQHGMAAVVIPELAGLGDEWAVEHIARRTSVPPKPGLIVCAGAVGACGLVPRQAARHIKQMRDPDRIAAVASQVGKRWIEIEHWRRGSICPRPTAWPTSSATTLLLMERRSCSTPGPNSTSRVNKSPTGRSFERR